MARTAPHRTKHAALVHGAAAGRRPGHPTRQMDNARKGFSKQGLVVRRRARAYEYWYGPPGGDPVNIF
jgi:hypothetical protein